jgi:hypothetical protein
MMAGLSLASDYIAEVRRLLQDERTPYRYADADIIEAINIGLLEAYRLRADFFLSSTVAAATPPTATTGASTITFPHGYRSSLVSYVTGRMLLRDAEPANDARANALMTRFTAQLLTSQA